MDYKILKNRKAIGTLQMQMVRTKSTPVILEMNQEMYDLEKEQLGEFDYQSSVAASTKVQYDIHLFYKKTVILPEPQVS